MKDNGSQENIHEIMAHAELDLQSIKRAIGETTLKESLISRDDNYHRKIDWNVAKRFLNIIYLHGPIRKTRLAMKTGVNSTTCTKYVTWLIEVDWIDVNDCDEFRLTQAGLAVSKRINSEDNA
ncbi:hypothetical protein Ngar_c11680 [Candidatus Nitrososphaera gargensis Ga9.2]|uniref:ArnR1-like winged helix-turn-helix domain-containing protein n=1 Tax=Nitrososphaera gargensis (strain Ga9.2) TaxID=1237085 RepID=K0IGY1_NITGG|nr:hypothetical protein [Candidatus Nitrososphaera gargensis]AFU58108.1 hypothetical protein Ngar_c11680 [Candidatus Nitrososphaera gargensis Ga9.2]